MTVLKCDRCGKTGYTNRGRQSNEIVRYGVHTDLCDECYEFFNIWLRKKFNEDDDVGAFLRDMGVEK